MRIAIQIGIASCLLISGCQPDRHVRILNDPASYKQQRIESARALNRFHGAAVTDALIAALDDDDSAVRYFAAESLADSSIANPEQRRRATQSLVELLNDSTRGKYCYKTGWPIVVDAYARTAPIRARALLILTVITDEDFGFDQTAWREYLERSASIYVPQPEQRLANVRPEGARS